ncbi:MAG: flagellar basal-body rod protein FlgF [Clostridia bacterium]|nr:flagellar basal-body rod protein FlgF [Clostridia bacterium]
MVRGLYLAGTGMLVQRSKMDVITNNISNVDTLGYKQDTLLSRSFEEMLIERMNDPAVVNQTTEVGPLGTGTHIDEIATSFAQGAPEQTGRSTDLCIVGDGFFVVEAGDGERYTRAGNFSLNAEGYLVDVNGNQVQGDGGGIQLKSDRFLVDDLGQIIDLDTNAQVGKLRLVEFTDTQGLRKEGDNLFSDYGGAGAKEAENSKVMQGYIEGSNVNIAQEMVDMIITSRAYETNQRSARMIDETLERAVNDIAKF